MQINSIQNLSQTEKQALETYEIKLKKFTKENQELKEISEK